MRKKDKCSEAKYQHEYEGPEEKNPENTEGL